MGGSSSPPPPMMAPPAPDYSPLARASEEQLRLAREISDNQLDWAKTQYNDNKGFSDAVRGRLLQTLDENTNESREQLARYKALYYPREEQFLRDVDQWGSADRKQQGRDRSVGNVGVSFDLADAAATRKLEMTGVDPSEVRYAALNRGSKLARAAASAQAANDSDRAIDSTALALKANALGMGKGQPAQALGFQTAGTQAGTAGVQAGNTTTASAAGSLGNPLGWGAQGTNAIGTWGNVLNAGYQNQLAGYTAFNNANAQYAQNQNNASSGWGQALGAAAGLGGMLLMAAEGGEVPDGAEDLPPGMAGEGAIPNLEVNGSRLPPSLSPSGGQQTDDIPAVGPGGSRIQVNAGEFIFPRRTAEWYGEKFLQNMILKADKEMQGAPAKPEIKAVDAGAGQEAVPGVMHAAAGGAVPRFTPSGIHAPRLSIMPQRHTSIGRTFPSIRRRAA